MADVRTSGPLFDGRAEVALRQGIIAARHAVAHEGEQLTRTLFIGSIHDDHGRFIATITTIDGSRVFATHGGRKTYVMPIVADRSAETLVTADLATYGPWLEGTGSRNETTRFKGYHGFRRASYVLNDTAEGVASRALEPYVREMN
jgi:hypothetical protein